MAIYLRELSPKKIGAWSSLKFTVSTILGEMPERRVIRSLNVLIYILEAYRPGWVAGDRGRRQIFAVATCLVNFFFCCICTDPGGFCRSPFRIRGRVPWAIPENKARSRWDLYEEEKRLTRPVAGDFCMIYQVKHTDHLQGALAGEVAICVYVQVKSTKKRNRHL